MNQIMMGQSYMRIYLFQTNQEAQLLKQEDENSSGRNSSSHNNTKIGTKLKQEAYLEPSKISTIELFCENSQLLKQLPPKYLKQHR